MEEPILAAWGAPRMERPYPSESTRDAQSRRARNRAARADWMRFLDARCARCGMARVHVTHETDPATSAEGPDYYADFLDQLHLFVDTA